MSNKMGVGVDVNWFRFVEFREVVIDECSREVLIGRVLLIGLGSLCEYQDLEWLFLIGFQEKFWYWEYE